MIWFVFAGHDFLAIREPVLANVLVIEGWTWNSEAMQEAAEEFSRGRYDVVVTVGVLSEGHVSRRTQDNSAALAAERLRKLGVDEHAVEVIAVPNIQRHRTYASALAVKRWLAHWQTETVGVNVFTLGPHARKSLILFKRAFGESVPVGVIAGTDDRYNSQRWWLSLRGIYTVLWNTVGYLYAEWWPLEDDHLSARGSFPRTAPEKA
jgi:hypothetical protein